VTNTKILGRPRLTITFLSPAAFGIRVYEGLSRVNYAKGYAQVEGVELPVLNTAKLVTPLIRRSHRQATIRGANREEVTVRKGFLHAVVESSRGRKVFFGPGALAKAVRSGNVRIGDPQR
jgi:hypothetical protein